MNDDNRHIEGYRRMLERAAAALKGAVDRPIPTIRHLIESARQTAVELKELTHDEAERIADYLRRDLHDAGEHLRAEEHELADWLRFDAALVEERVLEFLAPLADHTRLELERLALEAERRGWHTGDVTGPGTLACDACGETLHFRKPGHIPPCPKCRASVFHRPRD
jgi:hypothetical protein